MKLSKSILGLALLLVAPGCSSVTDCLTDHCTKVHSDLTAHEAWARWSWCYDELDCPLDFASGFRAGYQDILNGGRGCAPTLPPRHYWKPHFRNADGHCRINAWFAGFAHGVIAAEQDGAAAYGHVPISPTAQSNLNAANQPPAEYDWSAAGAPAAHGPSDPAPGHTPPADPMGTPNGTNTAPNGTYEDPAPPLPPVEDPVTTTGRVSIPSLGD